MSVEFSINFWSNFSMDSIASRIVDHFGFSIDPTHCGRSPLVKTVTLVRNNLVLDIRERGELGKLDEYVQDFYASELGIKVNRTIIIFPDPILFTSMSEDAEMLASINCDFLKRESGDLVMEYYGDQIILLRKDQKVSIHESSDFWNRRNEAALSIPHTREVLPIL